jgi:hypothetical protein
MCPGNTTPYVISNAESVLKGREYNVEVGAANVEPSHCTLPMFHPVMDASNAPDGVGYISSYGHHFAFSNPMCMQQAFHVCVVHLRYVIKPLLIIIYSTAFSSLTGLLAALFPAAPANDRELDPSLCLRQTYSHYLTLLGWSTSRPRQIIGLVSFFRPSTTFGSLAKRR